MSGEELGSKLGLHPHGICDFLNALHSRSAARRERRAVYSNTEETAHYSRYRICDIGGAGAMLSILVEKKHP
jgi:hypothetical protein